jgi:Pvc16 N-terminal domain
MIADLDRSIGKWLARDLPPGIKDSEISFVHPTQVSKGKLPAINIFLYDVHHNLDLRNNEWIVERQPDGKTTGKRAPVFVSCSFLISAWPEGPSPDPVEEHSMLGEVLKLFLANPKIPADCLEGSLQGMDTALTATPAQPGSRSLGELWQAFGGAPKAALDYCVNVGVEVGKPSQSWLVTRKTIKLELVEGVESD